MENNFSLERNEALLILAAFGCVESEATKRQNLEHERKFLLKLDKFLSQHEEYQDALKRLKRRRVEQLTEELEELGVQLA